MYIIVVKLAFHRTVVTFPRADHLDKVFECFKQSNLKLKPLKCNIFALLALSVEVLGHKVSASGIETNTNIESVMTHVCGVKIFIKAKNKC